MLKTLKVNNLFISKEEETLSAMATTHFSNCSLMDPHYAYPESKEHGANSTILFI